MRQFEEELAAYLGVEGVVTTSSGRAAQFLALKAAGVESGDKIGLPALTYPVVPLVVEKLGAEPVFLDIEPDTFLLDTEEFEEKAADLDYVIPTHLYGNICDLEQITAISERNSITVLEDFSHGLGSEASQPAGSYGLINFASMSISKEPTTVWGGLVTSNDREIIQRTRELQNNLSVGRNSRISILLSALKNILSTSPWLFTFSAFQLLKKDKTRLLLEEAISEDFSDRDAHIIFRDLTPFQAELGRTQVKFLDSMRLKKQRQAEAYRAVIPDKFKTQQYSSSRIKPLDFPVIVDRSEEVISALRNTGLDVPRGNMVDCSDLEYIDAKGDCPEASAIEERKILLPLDFKMTDKQLERNIQRVKQAFDEN